MNPELPTRPSDHGAGAGQPGMPSGQRRPASWRVLGVSVPGAGHLQAGTPCQDAHLHAVDPATGALILAVADGAGSQDRSAEGSALAVGTVVNVLRRVLAERSAPGSQAAWGDFLAEAADQVFDRFLAITDQVVALSPGPGDGQNRQANREALATTLTAVVLAVPWLGVISVGDGFVVVRTDPSDLHLLVPPSRDGRYANETTFLTTPGSRERARLEVAWDPGITGVALSTDGLTDASLDHHAGQPLRPHRGFFGTVFEHAAHRDPSVDRTVAQQLLSQEMNATTPDDKTLLLAVPEVRR